MSPNWIDALARLVKQINSNRFPAALRALLELACTFDSMIVTHYPPHARPISLYDDLGEVQAAIAVQFYSTGPYLLDPLYQHCHHGGEPGAYRLHDLTNEAFLRSPYYRTFYRNIRIGDEVGILIREYDNHWIIVSLARARRRPRFDDNDVTALETLFPLISAAVVRNWGGPHSDPEVANAIDDRLNSFARDVLSPREAEIVQLVLQGHSSRSLAAFLGITEGTVKAHRHNVYSKLGIVSQAELFSLATRHFASRQG